MTNLTPIETKYNGYRFRSRLEARWAIFFDALGIRYEYEKEGFNLNGLGPYLPDFYLPDIHGGMWAEIKPIGDDGLANKKMNKLVALTYKDGTVLYGEPMRGYLSAIGEEYWNDWARWFAPSIDFKPNSEFPDDDGVGWDCPYIFCICPWCGKIGFEFDGRGARVCGYKAHYENEEDALNAIKHLGHWRADDKCYTGDHQRILDACIAARSARFDKGA